MKKTLLLMAGLIFLLSGSSAFAAGKVTITEPLNSYGCIPKDTTFVLEIWLYHTDSHSGSSMPFSLYSEDGSITEVIHVADPGAISAEFPQSDTLFDSSIFIYNGWDAVWPLLFFFYGNNWDGILPDTINHTGLSLSGWTTADTTKYFGFNLRINQDGGSFCIDSIDHDNNTYDWLFDPAMSFGGPYCWCVGTYDDVASFEKRTGIPETFEMGQNYPNPFNMQTVIEYAVPYKSDVAITIYNVLGQKIKTIVNEGMTAGYHKATWDGTNQAGNEVSSGLYFYKITADNFKDTKKLMLLK